MSFDVQENSYNTASLQTTALERNKVLRSVYTLLALSMIPTVLGAAFAMYSNIAKAMLSSPIISMVVFFAGAFGLMYMIEKNKDRPAGVAWLMGFTFFMGMMLSRILTVTLSRYTNGGEIIMLAFGGTGVIFAGMAFLAASIKRDISGMGKFLFIGALIVMVVGIANVFLQLPGLSIALSAVVMVLFSAYLMYDLNQIMNGGETNYITATLAVYLDVFNIFQSLLSLLGFAGGNKD